MKKILTLAALSAFLAMSSGCSTFLFKQNESCGGDGKWLNWAGSTKNQTARTLIRGGFDIMLDRCSPNDVMYIKPTGTVCNPEKIECSYDGTMIKFDRVDGRKRAVNHFFGENLDNEFPVDDCKRIKQYYASLNPCKR